MPPPFDQALRDLDAHDEPDAGSPPPPAPLPAIPDPASQQPAGDPWAASSDDHEPIPMPSPREVALRASLRSAATKDPDAEATNQDLARQTGLPPDVVERNPAQVAAAAAARTVDPQDLLSHHPALAQWMSTPANAAVARDDVDALKHLDLTMRMLTDVAKPVPPVPMVEEAGTPTDPLPLWSGVVGQGARQAEVAIGRGAAVIPAMIQYLYRRLSGAEDPETYQPPNPATPLGAIYQSQDYLDAATKARATYAPSAVKDAATGMMGMVLNPTTFAAPAAGTEVAVARMAAIASAEQRALATLKATSALQGVQSGGQALEGTIEQRRERGEGAGLQASDAANALAQGAIGALTMRATGLVGPLALLKEEPLTLADMPRNIVGNAVLGGTQTGAGAIVQAGITGQPQPTGGDVARAYLEGAIPGALLASSAIPGAAFVSRARGLAMDAQRAQAAQQDALALARVGISVQNSATAKRAPGALQDLIGRIAAATGQTDTGKVYMQSEAWDQHWQAAGGNPEAIAGALTGDPQAYAHAKATGAPLAIPVESYAAQVGPSSHFAPLLEHTSLHPDGMTLAEANRFLQSAPDAMQKLSQDFQQEVAAVKAQRDADGEAVREQVKEQLIAAGMDASAADTSARAHEAFFETMAAHFTKGGKPTTAGQLADRFPLDVTREVPQAIRNKPFDQMDAALNQLRSGERHSQQEIYGPSLTDFLREKGGIQDTNLHTGDLAAMGADKPVPFKKRLVHEKGRALDAAAESAHAAGYLQENSVPELMNRLDDELRGHPTYSPKHTDQAKVDAAQSLDELHHFLKSIGADPSKHSNEEIRAKLTAAEGAAPAEPTREAAQGARTLYQAVQPRGTSLELRELVKRWNKVSPDRRPVPGDKDWQLLQHHSAKIDAMKGRSFLNPETSGEIPSHVERASVPYGAGHSDGQGEHGETVYVDHHIPDHLEVAKLDGGHAVLNPIGYIERHESFEENLMRHGMGYSRAHDLATAHEHEFLRADGFDPKDYEAKLKPFLDAAMHRHGRDIPEDLDRKPYREEGQERKLYQPAYHGTGNSHVYDRFDVSKIGGPGGEGAQAYGHGLYFAGKKEIGQYYRDTLGALHTSEMTAKAVKSATGIDLIDLGGGAAHEVYLAANDKALTVQKAAARLYQRNGVLRQFDDNSTATGPHPILMKMIEAVRASGKPGKLYHVEIPEDHELLSWDDGFRSQNEAIQKKLIDAGIVKRMSGGGFELANNERGSNPTGEHIYQALREKTLTAKDASEALRSAGIPGHRYLDGSSRADGEGAHNYVIYDDSRIAIKHYEQATRGSITIGGSRFKITLTPNADLSTFLHESGHYFLEVMNHLGTAEDAPAQIKADHQSIMDWLGVKDHAEIGVDQHETFARGLEHYFMEGKAPSAQLRPVFQRFKAWLQLVYGKLTNLHVQISPEVHAVFDRMFASEHEIAAAQERSGDTQTLPREHFGSDEEYGRYQEATAHARDAAETSLRVELMHAYQKEHMRRWQDEREEVRSGVADDVNNRPIYTAIAALQDGRLADGRSLPDNLQGLKINRDDLVERYGEEALKQLPGPRQRDAQGEPIPKANQGRRIYTGEGGLSLEQAADLFGYRSGDQFWHELVNAADRRTTIEAETDARMRERHPDPLTDGSIAERADKALATEQRGKLLSMEVAKLATKANATPTPRELLKLTAQRVISETPIGNLRPDLYRAAEAKARRKAFDAAATADHGTAFTESQRALLNHELFREASKAKDQADKIQRFATSLTTPAARERIGKAGGWEWTVSHPDGSRTRATTEQGAREIAEKIPGSTFDRTSSYLDQVDAILDRFDFARQSPKAKLRTQSLSAWSSAQAARGMPEVVIPEVMRENILTPWRRLTTQQLNGVYDTLRNITSLARGQNRLLEVAKAQTLLERATSAAAAMVANKPVALKPRQGSSPFSTITDTVGKFFNWQTRVPDLIYRMDGHEYGGKLFDAWQKGINEATDHKLEKTAASIGEIDRLMDEWGKLGPKGIHAWKINQREHIPEINDSLNKWAQIMVALHFGSDGNRERLLDGQKWTAAQAMAVINRLDAKDIAFVNGLVKHINSPWSEIAALEQRTHGFAPEKVKGIPYEAAGGHVDGGYVPIVYDQRLSRGTRPNADQEAQDMLAGRGSASSFTSHGHTKERGNSQGRALDLSFGVIPTHLGKVIHDLTMREVLIDNNRLLLSEPFRDTMIGHYGAGAYDQFAAQLRGIASGPTRTNTGMEPFLGYIRMGGNAAMRSFNVAGSIQQLAGMPFIIPRVGYVNALKAIGAAFNPAAHHFMEEQSPTMRFRNAERGKMLNEANNRAATLAPLNIVKDTAYLFMNTAWKVLDAHAWYAMYYKQLAEHGDEERAGKIADQFVPDTQGATDTKDMSEMMRGGEISKVFTNNMSWSNASLNLMLTSMHRFVDKGRSGPAAVRLVSDMAVYLVVAPAIYMGMRQVLAGDTQSLTDPQKEAKNLGSEVAYSLLSTLPFARDAAPLLENGRRYEGPQGASSIGALTNAGVGLLHDSKPGRSELTPKERAAIHGLGILFHAPSSQILHMLDGWFYAETHHQNPILPTLMGPPPRPEKR